jgi:hypothetical protein
MSTLPSRAVLLCSALILGCAGGNGSSPDSDLADSVAATGDVGEGETGDDGDGGDAGIEDDASESPCRIDGYEPNNEPEQAAVLAWDEQQRGRNRNDARVVVDARLCAAEHDWYAVAIADLGYREVRLAVDGLVAGASWCGHIAGCEGESLTSAPGHTLAVEIYDAEAMVLLTAAVATDGRIDLDLEGPEYGKDLLLHVYSPTRAASFTYELHIAVRDYEGGAPDCEC